MKKIEACFTYIKMLPNAEHYEFYDLIYNNLKTRIKSLYIISPLWNGFEVAFEREKNIFVYNLHNHQSDDINDANKGRIYEFQALRRDVKYFIKSEDINISESAEIIFTEVLKKYGYIENAGSALATDNIKKIVCELTQNEHLAVHVKRLGLEKRIAKLNRQNKDFEEFYIARQIEKGKKAERGTMRDLRPITDRTFKIITDAINSLYQINEIGDRDAGLRMELDDIIDYINISVKHIEAKLVKNGRLNAGNDKIRQPRASSPTLPRAIMSHA